MEQKNYLYVERFDRAIDVNIVRRRIVREAMTKVLELQIEFLMHGKKEIILAKDITLKLLTESGKELRTREDFKRTINFLKSEVIRINSDTWDYKKVDYRLQLIFASIIVNNEKEIRKQLENKKGA